MIIEWEIVKKRGNMRPLLKYCVRLEEHEQALALPGVSILSTIPRPVESWQEHCYPNQYERAEEPVLDGCYPLESPSHKGHSKTHSLKLPWRAGNAYPEVEESFVRLRETLEKELLAASSSAPMDIKETLGATGGTKAAIAPGVLGERFLRLAAQAGQRDASQPDAG